MKTANSVLFWTTIEESWTRFETSLGDALHPGGCFRDDVFDGEVMDPSATIAGFGRALEGVLNAMPNDARLAAFLREFERNVFDLDRRELAHHLRVWGEDFVSARCFLVAMGERYFDRVMADPRTAPVDITFARTLYSRLRDTCEARLGAPLQPSTFNVASRSNPAGWPSLRLSR